MLSALSGPLLAALSCAAAPAAPVTYCKDVAPLLWKNCAGCHRPGEVGPFPLLSYHDAAKRADFIAKVTGERQMPPWKAEPGFGSFHDERRLSDAEVKLLADWAAAGAPEGDPRDLPAAPKFTDGWHAGEPDLILSMPEAFTVPASGRDVYRCFVIPTGLKQDRTVAAVEFRPGNRKVVHHAIMYLDHRGAARKKDESQAGPGFVTFGGPGFVPTGGLGAWTPGSTPRPLPDGVGRYLRAGSDLALQVHYHPSGKEEQDRSSVGIYFTKTPAEKFVTGVALRGQLGVIKPGDGRHHVTAKTEPLPADANALSVSPHMHLLGREMKVWARKPDGTEIPLVWVKDWDFNWQGAYAFAQPQRLPKGTVIHLDSYYDNSAANPRNPSDPPKPVRWGEGTNDEMCLCGVQVVADTRADLLKLAKMRESLLGNILGGAVPEEVLRGGGFPIPERYKSLLTPHDKDGDGTISDAEVKAMPALLRGRVEQKLRELGR